MTLYDSITFVYSSRTVYFDFVLAGKAFGVHPLLPLFTFTFLFFFSFFHYSLYLLSLYLPTSFTINLHLRPRSRMTPSYTDRC